MRRFWTDAERDTLRRLYGEMPAPALAKRLHRSVRAVYQEADKQGLRKVHRVKTGLAFRAEVRRRNAQGWSDTEIAAEIGCERHTVARWRTKLGLPSNEKNERWRQKIIAGVRRQCERDGLSSPAEIRKAAWARFAVEGGWPADLRPREVQILDALASQGPMTRRQIADALGLPWLGSRASLKARGEGGSYLAVLARRGLVVSLGRIVRTGGKGHNVHVYALSLTAERSTDGEVQPR